MSSFFLMLPFEFIYRILDHLDDEALIFSARNVCKRLNLILDTYYPYQVIRNIMIDSLFSDDESQILDALSEYQRIINQRLHAESRQLDIQIITLDVVSRLVQLLTSENDKFQKKALRILLNVTGGSSKQTKYVVDAGTVPILIQLMQSPNEITQEDAIWMLSNIAGDNKNYRDFVLDHGILEPLLNVLSDDTCTLTMLEVATWCLSNLCRFDSPSVDFPKIPSIIPILSRLLQNNTDTRILRGVCYIIRKLIQQSNKLISTVIENSVIPRLVTLLEHTVEVIRLSALTVIKEILGGNDQEKQMVLDDDGFLPHLSMLFDVDRTQINENLCDVIVNITAGTESQIQAVIDADIFPRMIQFLYLDADKIKERVACTIRNSTRFSSTQTEYFVGQGAIPLLFDLLRSSETKIIEIVLEGLQNILGWGVAESKQMQNSNPYTMLIKELNELDKVEELRSHRDNEVAARARHIIETYFDIR
ncbi:unnamed protein product [Adineta ricciae]|uniref:Importin subunit alpha n=1 Tax=Adineta ricciae TaxID=249248 RepID=A0A815X345_ADIRI|nr:unnamed protein product [Adineta ricciae]